MKPFNLKEYRKDPTKKIVARNGRDARIICTNKEGNNYPIIALVKNSYGESIISYLINGRQSNTEDTPYDLFFAPEKKVGWVNIFRGKDGPITGDIIFSSKEEAEESSMHCCGFTNGLYLTTVKVEWEE